MRRGVVRSLRRKVAARGQRLDKERRCRLHGRKPYSASWIAGITGDDNRDDFPVLPVNWISLVVKSRHLRLIEWG